MRDILFRGKRLDNGEWVYGFLYCFYDFRRKVVQILRDRTNCIPDTVEVIPETVGQHTGKTVKNGKVFDGDILRSIDGLSLVCWDEEKSSFVMRLYEYPHETLYLEEMFDDSEIIGNIHDNNELLKDSLSE